MKKEDVIIVTQPSVSDDEEIVIGRELRDCVFEAFMTLMTLF